MKIKNYVKILNMFILVTLFSMSFSGWTHATSHQSTAIPNHQELINPDESTGTVIGDVAFIYRPGENVKPYEIHTQEDLLALNEHPDVYAVLKSDLKLDLDDEGISAITTTFIGTFNGNGYTISDLTKPLFDKLSGSVFNLNVEDVHIQSAGSEVGLLARTTDGAKIYDVRGDDITIEGESHRIGGLIGEARNSFIEHVQLTDISVTGGGFYIGGLVGRAWNTDIDTVVVEGDLFMSTTANGGLVGAVRDGSTVVDAFVDVDVARTSNKDWRQANGGIIGQFESKDNHLETSMSYGNQTAGIVNQLLGVYKTVWAHDLNILPSSLKTVYELSDTTGYATVNYFDEVFSITQAEAKSKFYIGELGWETEKWDYAESEPRLFNRDGYGEKTVLEYKDDVRLDENIHYIYHLDDLIEANHEGINVLMNDIDASEWLLKAPVIGATFEGKLDGNGYAIENLTQPLFFILEGTVHDLMIKDATVFSESDEMGALARYAIDADVYDVKGENISVTGGKHRIGSLVGQSRDSNFERIDVENINVSGSGFYVGGVIGRAFATDMHDIFAQGTVTVQTTSNGGIVGAIKDETILNHVVSHVDVIRDGIGDVRTANGGVYGNMENFGNKVKNSIALGSASDEVGDRFGVYKFGYRNDIFASSNTLENNYEINEYSGLSSQKSTFTINQISKSKLTDTFYEKTLGLDVEIWDLSGDVPRLK